MVRCLVAQFRLNHRNCHTFTVCLNSDSPPVFKLAFLQALYAVLNDVSFFTLNINLFIIPLFLLLLLLFLLLLLLLFLYIVFSFTQALAVPWWPSPEVTYLYAPDLRAIFQVK